MKQVLDRLRADELSMEAGRLEINRVVASVFDLEWWDTLSDLRTGDSSHARRVREAFREGDELESDADAVRDDQLEAFVETVGPFGF